MERTLNPRRQGDLGEASAIEWLASIGATVFVPPVQLSTRGGNQSWNGTVKRVDRNDFDVLVALVGDGRRWAIPAEALEAQTAIQLGGGKYAEYEVRPGIPIEGSRPRRPGNRLYNPSPLPGERRRWRVGRDCKFRASG